MAAVGEAPRVYLTHFANPDTGEQLWGVTDRGMPLCEARPDEMRARNIYADRWRRASRWDAYSQCFQSDIPVEPPVWNGDLGVFEVTSA